MKWFANFEEKRSSNNELRHPSSLPPLSQASTTNPRPNSRVVGVLVTRLSSRETKSLPLHAFLDSTYFSNFSVHLLAYGQCFRYSYTCVPVLCRRVFFVSVGGSVPRKNLIVGGARL